MSSMMVMPLFPKMFIAIVSQNVLCLMFVYIFPHEHHRLATLCKRRMVYTRSARRYLGSAEYCHIEYWSVGPDEFPVTQ